VALFKIDTLTDPKHRFKVDSNARQLSLSGCALLFDDLNMVVVEGGAKAIRKFKKLMLNRIDWKSKSDDSAAGAPQDDKEVVAKKNNTCSLVWEGSVLKTNFQQFRFETLSTEAAVRKYLNQHWSEHYFDLARNFKAEEVS